MGEPPDRIPETAATKTGVQTVKKVILQQSKYWKCLYPKGKQHVPILVIFLLTRKDVVVVSGAERMHGQSKHAVHTQRATADEL